MRQSHIAGERLFVDYAGGALAVIDGLSGEVRTAQLFVAASPCSAGRITPMPRLPGRRACPTGSARTRTFEFIGGVPAMVVSDNLRSGISKACFYEPAVNRTYAEMAAHYDAAIVPDDSPQSTVSAVLCSILRCRLR